MWCTLQAWSKAAPGKAGGPDLITVEMVAAWPLAVKVVVWKAFMLLYKQLAEVEASVWPDWELLELVGIQKLGESLAWEGRRWIAKSSIGAKTWHRCLLAAARAVPRRIPFPTLGVMPGRSTMEVVQPIAWAIQLAKSYGVPLFVFEADIKACFDEMRHELFLGALLERRWPPEVVLAFVQDYERLKA